MCNHIMIVSSFTDNVKQGGAGRGHLGALPRPRGNPRLDRARKVMRAYII